MCGGEERPLRRTFGFHCVINGRLINYAARNLNVPPRVPRTFSAVARENFRTVVGRGFSRNDLCEQSSESIGSIIKNLPD